MPCVDEKELTRQEGPGSVEDRVNNGLVRHTMWANMHDLFLGKRIVASLAWGHSGLGGFDST